MWREAREALDLGIERSLVAAGIILTVLFVAAVPLSSDTLRRRMVETLSKRLRCGRRVGRLESPGVSGAARRRSRPRHPQEGAHRRTAADFGQDVPRRRESDGTAAQARVARAARRARNQHPARRSATMTRTTASRPARTARLVRPPRASKRASSSTPWTRTTRSSSSSRGRKTRRRRSGRFTRCGCTTSGPINRCAVRGDTDQWRAARRDRRRPDTSARGSPKTRDVTPLDGTFTFDNADLSVFKGIAGTLSSRELQGLAGEDRHQRRDRDAELHDPDQRTSVRPQGEVSLHRRWHQRRHAAPSASTPRS